MDAKASDDTMLAVVFTGDEGEGTDPFPIWRVPRPKPKEGQVQVRVSHFGLNFADVMARKGSYKDAPPFPFSPGYEVSGVVTEVGPGCNRIKVGDRVGAFIMFGGYCEYACPLELGTFVVPEGMTMEEAAGIPVAYATAYHCLYNTGPVRKGDKALVHAAAGGVGLALVQMCKNAGLEVFATASSPAKHKLLKEEYGVDHIIDYTKVEFAPEIARIEKKNPEEPRCIDLVFDSVGGSQFKTDLTLLRPGGRLVGYGVAALNTPSGFFNKLGLFGDVVSMLTINNIDLLMNSVGFQGVNMKRIGDDRPDIMKECLDGVLQMFAEKKCKLHIHKVYDWQHLHKAHQDIESRGTIGKLVIRVGTFPDGKQ